MIGEASVFDNVPKYLLSSDAEFKKRALEMLKRELGRQEVRKPWRSIEPFIIALYHVVFIDGDLETGSELLKYLERILLKNRISLPVEVQEVADIILHAVRAEIGETDKNSVLNYLQNYITTSLISTLVKKIVFIELSGEYDDHLNELLKKVGNNMERKLQYLESLLEDPGYRDVAERFFIDLDVAQFSREPQNILFIHTYFIHRAKELQKEYEERRRIIEPIKAELEELKQRYDNEIVTKLSENIKTLLLIVMSIVGIIADILYELITNNVIVATSATAVTLALIAIRQFRDIIVSIVSKLSNAIARRTARYTKEGRNVLKEISNKERELSDLETRLRKLR